MRIELEKLQGGKGGFAHVYRPEELDPIDERSVALGIVLIGVLVNLLP